MKATINQVAHYLAFEFGMNEEDLVYMLTELEKKIMKEQFTRLTPINECKVIKVIEVKSLVGDGVAGSPIKEIREYYSLDGVRLARYVPNETDLGFGIWGKDDEEGV